MGRTECLVGGDGAVRVPKTSSLLSQQGWLCLAGTRQLRAAQGVSNTGSCRAQAGQATHAWQPAHGAISVHRRMGRALQAVIASLSPPSGRKMTPPGLRALPCRGSAHFCSTTEHPNSSGSWPSQHLSSHSPTAAPRFPHRLAAGPKAARRHQSQQLLPLHRAAPSLGSELGLTPRVANPQLSILPSE